MPLFSLSLFFYVIIIPGAWRLLFLWEIEIIWFVNLTAFFEGNAFLLFSFHRITNLGAILCNSLRTRFPNVSYIRIWNPFARAGVFHFHSLNIKQFAKTRFISGKWRQLLRTLSVSFLLLSRPFHLERPAQPLCGFWSWSPFKLENGFSLFSFFPPSIPFSHGEILICFIMGSCGGFYALRGNMVC